MTTDQKYQLLDRAREAPVHFDTGEQAFIYGAKLDYATVATLDWITQRVYAWETVARILATPGRTFKV